MSIQAKLIIDDKSFNVLECNFSFKRSQDASGRPSSYTKFRGVNMVIEATRDTIFWEWAISATEKKQAELHFTPRHLGTKTRKLYLIDAYCVAHRTYFNNNNAIPVTETITLSCGGFKDSNFEDEFSAHWRETFPMNSNVEETVLEEKSPQINDSFFEDEQGNKLNKLSAKKKVFFIVKTSDMIGKSIDIDLSKYKLDFEYKGELLDNNLLTDVSVTSDLCKIELKTLKRKK